ncbi:unnamed protein product, partial [Ilex paraguariensis]
MIALDYTCETMLIRAGAKSSGHWWQLSSAEGSLDLRPINDDTMRPLGTISSERDLRK